MAQACLNLCDLRGHFFGIKLENLNQCLNNNGFSTISPSFWYDFISLISLRCLYDEMELCCLHALFSSVHVFSAAENAAWLRTFSCQLLPGVPSTAESQDTKEPTLPMVDWLTQGCKGHCIVFWSKTRYFSRFTALWGSAEAIMGVLCSVTAYDSQACPSPLLYLGWSPVNLVHTRPHPSRLSENVICHIILCWQLNWVI